MTNTTQQRLVLRGLLSLHFDELRGVLTSEEVKELGHQLHMAYEDGTLTLKRLSEITKTGTR